MKALILILFGFLAAASCGASEKEALQPGQVEPNVPAERTKRLEEVDGDIAKLRQGIASTYERRISDLRRYSEEQIRLFETAERSALMKTAVRPVRFLANLGFVPRDGYSKTEDGLMIPNEQIALTEKRIAEKNNEMQQDLEERIAALEREKNYFLTVDLADREKQLKNAVLNPRPETHGLLGGIVYGEEKRSALVDREIVHEGEDIYGARVVRIYRRGVIVTKNRQTWELKVGELAAAFGQQ